MTPTQSLVLRPATEAILKTPIIKSFACIRRAKPKALATNIDQNPLKEDNPPESPRDGKHLEVLGYYNPLPGQDGGKRMGLNFDRVKYWLSVGAQPSDPIQRILFRAGLLPPPPMLAMARKGGPRDPRVTDPLTGRYIGPKNPSIADQPKGDDAEGDGQTDEVES